MTDTPYLGLPLIEAAQAQKHVTHNEALALLDLLVQLAVNSRALTAPPATPADGDRYIVKATATGAFAGKENQIAQYAGAGWLFYAPHTGWLAYAADEGILLAWDGSAWISVGGSSGDITSLQNLTLLGIGATADSTNPFSAKLNNALWVAKTVGEGGDGTLRYKLSKENASKNLSFLFQDNFSGRAEIGLTGDDDFHFKVSADGSSWIDALILDKTTGSTKLNTGLFLAGDISPSQITSDQNDYNPTGFSTSSILRLSSDASRNITGLSGGGDGRIIAVVNAGSNSIVLKDASASSSAANRFGFGADVTLSSKQSALLWYDATDSRWKLLAAPQNGGGSGSVTSVGLALPGIFSVSGSPVTTSGTLTATLATQNVNLVWASPISGSAAAPTFRALVAADLPTVDVAHGGTGDASLTPYAVLCGGTTSTGTVQGVASIGTAGQVLTSNGTGALPTFQTAGGSSLNYVVPQGRLTLASATPVMASSVSAATTVYYTPYVGRYVPIFNGTSFVITDIGGELSQATTDSTKSPAAVAANKNYDIFVWNDSGTIRATRGPAWSSDTARGTGAGTTELERVQGVSTNKVAITNGPAANRGTYVGTIRSNGLSQIDYIFGGSAAGGTAAWLGVWNYYNRVDVGTTVTDSTTSWTYGAASPRAMNSSNANRVCFVSGVAEDGVLAMVNAAILTASPNAAFGYIGLKLDATDSSDKISICYNNNGGGNLLISVCATSTYVPQTGFHFIQAVESGDGATTATFFGASYQGLHVRLKM